MKTQHITLIVVCMLIFTTQSNAEQKPTNRLKTLKHKISTLKNQIQHTRYRKQHVETQLETTDRAIDQLSKRLRTLKRKQYHQQQKLKKLNKKARRLKIKLNQNRKSLDQIIRQAYFFSRTSELQLLLNTEDPNQLERNLKEYAYLTQSQAKTLNRLKTRYETLQSTRQAIRRTLKQIQTLNHKKTQQKRRLEAQNTRRKQLIRTLQTHLKNRQKRLKKLKHDREHLVKIIQKLASTSHPQQRFRELKGQLPWPTKGRIIHNYGSYFPHTHLKRHGVTLSAELDQTVHAVADGIVIFANWLSGYGLLMIIDHGHGYMTLYGHNQSLYKTVGDHVQQDDTIASVGQSGGYIQPSLYFAIRYNGKPIDPTRWLSNH